jgi:hypothetical protein
MQEVHRIYDVHSIWSDDYNETSIKTGGGKLASHMTEIRVTKRICFLARSLPDRSLALLAGRCSSFTGPVHQVATASL